ncbi:MAG: hypothetical protein KAS32_12435 [Candidatus Peribacteraceae bacterium]|nr:hypothetical protein [Candidatus Peribacteraceae bacterium]
MSEEKRMKIVLYARKRGISISQLLTKIPPKYEAIAFPPTKKDTKNKLL